MKWILMLAVALLPPLAHSDCPPPGHSQLAIIIDDIGYHRERGMAFAQMPHPLTLSILPGTPHGKAIARTALTQGKEVMVHMPMASHDASITAPFVLTEQLTLDRFNGVLNEALAQVPGATGLNNHMGSALTESRDAMNTVMAFLAENQFFFIDSRTTPATVAAEAAKIHQIPYASRAVFLDNTRAPTEIANKLAEAMDIAQARGQAIAIGHAYPETLALLSQALLRLPAGISLAPASAVTRCTGS